MPDTVALEDMIAGLAMYGQPHIMLHDDGTWSCWAKLRTNMPEAAFEVKCSYGKHRELRPAVEECLQKAMHAVGMFEFVPKSK